MTSVPLRIPSTKLSLQPYKLSNLLFVTESLTLMAGTCNVPLDAICSRRRTPVVVSSERPLTFFKSSGYFSCIRSVKSPPSSKIILGSQPSASIVWSMHHQNSSSFMPFQAKTGVPLSATAAAA